VRDQLDRLVDEMLRKGILYDDARQAIERRFITRALSRSEGNLGQAADLLGIHRNTLTRKMTAYRLKRTG
jgi:DNA-binding NtrC family response regulator